MPQHNYCHYKVSVFVIAGTNQSPLTWVEQRVCGSLCKWLTLSSSTNIILSLVQQGKNPQHNSIFILQFILNNYVSIMKNKCKKLILSHVIESWSFPRMVIVWQNKGRMTGFWILDCPRCTGCLKSSLINIHLFKVDPCTVCIKINESSYPNVYSSLTVIYTIICKF